MKTLKNKLSLIISIISSGVLSASTINSFTIDFNEKESVLNFNFEKELSKTPSIIYNREIKEIIIPFDNINNNKIKSEYKISENEIDTIVFKEINKTTYAKINLLNDVPFTIKNNGKNFQLLLKNNQNKSEQNIVVNADNVMIEDINFKVENGNPVISIKSNKENILYNKTINNDIIELRFKNSIMPSRLFRNMNVEDFNTPVKNILSNMENNDVVIKIFLQKESNIDIKNFSSSKNLYFIINEKNKVLENKENKEEKLEYSGSLISFDYFEIPISAALKLIADEMGVNLVVSDSVRGNITLQLNQVPYDQALDIILQTKGLEKRKNGNILFVAPLEEIIKREEIALQSKNKIKDIEPLKMELIQIKYAKSKDLSNVLNNLISPRGRIIFDERTNKLMIEDTVEKLEELKNMVSTLDIPIRQVIIEARIVFAKENLREELGVKWSGGYQNLSDSSLGMISGTQQGLTNIASNANNIGGTINPPNASLVSMGLSNPTSSIAFGYLNSSLALDLELSALEKNGDIEIISRPKIITADKKEAEIKSGTQFPYVELTENGSGAIAFKDIDLALKVTPHITPNDKVILDLNIIQDSISELTQAGPAIDSTEITTQILANNGETIVLGGIFRSEKINEVDKTPVLGDIPMLGNLFKRTINSDDKVELIIFITPKLIDSDYFK